MYECRGGGDSRRVGSVDGACCGSGDPRLGGAGARDTRGRDSRVVCVDLCRGSEDTHRGDPGRGLHMWRSMRPGILN